MRYSRKRTALLMPWHDTEENSWKNDELQKNIDKMFPVKSRRRPAIVRPFFRWTRCAIPWMSRWWRFATASLNWKRARSL